MEVSRKTQLEVRRKKPMRVYIDVARELKKEIVSGVYPVGSQLPTEVALCKRFAVGRHTIREALKLLRDDRLVTSRQGAGTVVVPSTTSETFLLDAVSIDDLSAYATDMYTEIHSTKMELVAGKLAARLGVASGEEWLAVRGFAHARGQALPVCTSEHYIHREFAAVGRLLQRHTGPISSLIETVSAQTIVEITHDILATLIPPTLAADLDVPPGSAAIEVRRTFKTSDGKVAQVTVHTHPASRFRLSMTMRRDKN
jgi:DNA-binding GntR family transcriptional regulator